MPFPVNFIWGTASSAYQVEGAWDSDLKGPSIWDTFCHTDGNIAYNQTGDISCNHYEHYLDDIKLMHELGIKAYRFSISWPRIFPYGDNILNPLGLKFYDDLVNALLDYGITPYITLYHWDLPQALEDKGGWLNRDTTTAFAEYSAFVCEHFRDRVGSFITINEPQIISMLGYYYGKHAPGMKLSISDTLKVLHHLALAHGKAVTSMRKAANGKRILIGFSSTGTLCSPVTDEYAELARNLSFTITKDNWNFCHHIFCDAVCFGRYPDVTGTVLDGLFAFMEEEDMDIICQPIDFIGLNIYNGHLVGADGEIARPDGYPRTALKWPITPEVINWGVRFMYDRYQLPIFITENGLSCNDKIYLDGKVHDLDRIDFLTRYLNELKKAIDNGADVLGYFHWSFTDNFEWHSGYEERFGLVYIDYETQDRIIKDSGYWYADFIKTD